MSKALDLECRIADIQLMLDRLYARKNNPERNAQITNLENEMLRLRDRLRRTLNEEQFGCSGVFA